MSQYLIKTVEELVSKANAPYKTGTLESSDNKTLKFLAFPKSYKKYAEVVPEALLDAVLTATDKGDAFFLNDGNMGVRPAWAKTSKPEQIREAQDRRAEHIKEAQERKEESIAYFNSLNAAIQFVSAFQPKQDPPPEADSPQAKPRADKNEYGALSIGDFCEKVLEMRDRFLKEWQEYDSKNKLGF